MFKHEFTEFFYGERFNEHVERFKAELITIERQHIEWFRNRATKKEGELHDRLHHHYIFEFKNETLNFRFVDGTELPGEIRAKSMEAFYRNFAE